MSSNFVSWLLPTRSSRSSYWRAWSCHVHWDSGDRSRCGLCGIGLHQLEPFLALLETLLVEFLRARLRAASSDRCFSLSRLDSRRFFAAFPLRLWRTLAR